MTPLPILDLIAGMIFIFFLMSIISNSIFEVKRDKVMEMDKAGAFIPLATKRVFLKYYANENSRHYSVWTATEREAYLKEIEKCIETYKQEKKVTNEE